MNRRRFVVFTSLAMALLVAVGGFDLLNGPARRLEAWLVMATLRPVGSRASVVNDTFFQLLPPNQVAFRAQLTPYCSSLIPVLALATIAVTDAGRGDRALEGQARQGQRGADGNHRLADSRTSWTAAS